jgi:hypothetical protein
MRSPTKLGDNVQHDDDRLSRARLFDPNSANAAVAEHHARLRAKHADTFPPARDDEAAVVRRHFKPDGSMTRYARRLIAPVARVHRPIARAPRARRLVRRAAARSPGRESDPPLALAGGAR